MYQARIPESRHEPSHLPPAFRCYLMGGEGWLSSRGHYSTTAARLLQIWV